MKKIIIIFVSLSLLVFLRPALGLSKDQKSENTIEQTTIEEVELSKDNGLDGAFDGIKQFYNYTGFANATGGHLAMILIGIIFIYLGIKFDYEPLLLIPIGTGVILGNIPFVFEKMKVIFFNNN